MNGESDGVEASPHEVHMWCSSSKYARARGGAGGGWSCVEMWMLWNGVLRLPVRFRVTRAERLCGKRREGEL